jgi:hypothetical protein
VIAVAGHCPFFAGQAAAPPADGVRRLAERWMGARVPLKRIVQVYTCEQCKVTSRCEDGRESVSVD